MKTNHSIVILLTLSIGILTACQKDDDIETKSSDKAPIGLDIKKIKIISISPLVIESNEYEVKRLLLSDDKQIIEVIIKRNQEYKTFSDTRDGWYFVSSSHYDCFVYGTYDKEENFTPASAATQSLMNYCTNHGERFA